MTYLKLWQDYNLELGIITIQQWQLMNWSHYRAYSTVVCHEHSMLRTRPIWERLRPPLQIFFKFDIFNKVGYCIAYWVPVLWMHCLTNSSNATLNLYLPKNSKIWTHCIVFIPKWTLKGVVNHFYACINWTSLLVYRNASSSKNIGTPTHSILTKAMKLTT